MRKIKYIISVLIISFISTCLKASPLFNKSKDIIIANYDIKPDKDDVHCIAALGSMLRHKDMKGIKLYAVAGTYGDRKASFIEPTVPKLFNYAFGKEWLKWADAHHNKNKAIDFVVKLMKNTFKKGGSVFIAEGGPSDFTYSVFNVLLNDGITKQFLHDRVILVQHSYRNEMRDMSDPIKLKYVKENCCYKHIADGNKENNGTPGYVTFDNLYLNNLSMIKNKKIKRLWEEANRICSSFKSSWENPVIQKGGLDFSDHVEMWWILGENEQTDNVNKFWKRYVFNRE